MAGPGTNKAATADGKNVSTMSSSTASSSKRTNPSSPELEVHKRMKLAGTRPDNTIVIKEDVEDEQVYSTPRATQPRQAAASGASASQIAKLGTRLISKHTALISGNTSTTFSQYRLSGDLYLRSRPHREINHVQGVLCEHLSSLSGSRKETFVTDMKECPALVPDKSSIDPMPYLIFLDRVARKHCNHHYTKVNLPAARSAWNAGLNDVEGQPSITSLQASLAETSEKLKRAISELSKAAKQQERLVGEVGDLRSSNTRLEQEAWAANRELDVSQKRVCELHGRIKKAQAELSTGVESMPGSTSIAVPTGQ